MIILPKSTTTPSTHSQSPAGLAVQDSMQQVDALHEMICCRPLPVIKREETEWDEFVRVWPRMCASYSNNVGLTPGIA